MEYNADRHFRGMGMETKEKAVQAQTGAAKGKKEQKEGMGCGDRRFAGGDCGGYCVY